MCQLSNYDNLLIYLWNVSVFQEIVEKFDAADVKQFRMS